MCQMYRPQMRHATSGHKYIYQKYTLNCHDRAILHVCFTDLLCEYLSLIISYLFFSCNTTLLDLGRERYNTTRNVHRISGVENSMTDETVDAPNSVYQLWHVKYYQAPRLQRDDCMIAQIAYQLLRTVQACGSPGYCTWDKSYAFLQHDLEVFAHPAVDPQQDTSLSGAIINRRSGKGITQFTLLHC
jgi:hypothetical protein